MLAFKKNIYERPEDESGFSLYPDPYDLLMNTLISDRNIFIGLGRLNPKDGNEKSKNLFPHASSFGNLPILNSISKRLLECLVDRSNWYELNAYHLCYIYDSLCSIFEEYNYDEPEKRMDMFPELNGANIDLNTFLNDYFYDTAFLIDPDRFNDMNPEEKKEKGLQIPCLFGVINRLVPTEEEISLKKLEESPYPT